MKLPTSGKQVRVQCESLAFYFFVICCHKSKCQSASTWELHSSVTTIGWLQIKFLAKLKKSFLWTKSIFLFVTLFTIMTSDWILFLSVNCKAVKHLGDNTGENPNSLQFADGFWEMMLNVWPVRQIIDKLNFIKIKFLFSVKDIIKK